MLCKPLLPPMTARKGDDVMRNSGIMGVKVWIVLLKAEFRHLITFVSYSVAWKQFDNYNGIYRYVHCCANLSLPYI